MTHSERPSSIAALRVYFLRFFEVTAHVAVAKQGGAPLRALDYAAQADILDRILRQPAPVSDREELDRLAEALQKQALDHAFAAFGLAPKYQTGAPPSGKVHARAWLAFAREMGRHRLLSRHPLNPKLFSAQMLAERPEP